MVYSRHRQCQRPPGMGQDMPDHETNRTTVIGSWESKRFFPGCLIAVSFLACLGCGDVELPSSGEPIDSLEEAGSQFDPSMVGTIRGRVSWQGAVPVAAPFYPTI